MNKILSQALKKAVSEYSPDIRELTKEKRPDLFSLSNDTELFQNEKGIIIKIDRSRDANLTDFGRATLTDRYLGPNESIKIYLHVLQVHTLMTIYTLKGFIIILVIYGSCLQLQSCQMVELKEVYQFHVF